mmetsp:Transcript_36092/g.62418  ORF Transcript_36092/g.62418 Transcript_36092/m.62418 type:complete len:221 (-) Transcript_36092:340-1002(-)
MSTPSSSISAVASSTASMPVGISHGGNLSSRRSEALAMRALSSFHPARAIFQPSTLYAAALAAEPLAVRIWSQLRASSAIGSAASNELRNVTLAVLVPLSLPLLAVRANRCSASSREIMTAGILMTRATSFRGSLCEIIREGRPSSLCTITTPTAPALDATSTLESMGHTPRSATSTKPLAYPFGSSLQRSKLSAGACLIGASNDVVTIGANTACAHEIS